jgi:DUF971 family protein
VSFWDHIKPASQEPSVQEAALEPGGKALRLVWEDGRVTELPARLLRQNCPCASCVDEWTSRRTLDPALIKPDLVLRDASWVGRYALRLSFADGHATGLYTWKLLRELASPKAV